jgi:predicted Ser/Thr protein kinase
MTCRSGGGHAVAMAIKWFGGDTANFAVFRLQPSRLKAACIAKTEPGDENNQASPIFARKGTKR